jgi:hypothetical protein
MADTYQQEINIHKQERAKLSLIAETHSKKGKQLASEHSSFFNFPKHNEPHTDNNES